MANLTRKEAFAAAALTGILADARREGLRRNVMAEAWAYADDMEAEAARRDEEADNGKD